VYNKTVATVQDGHPINEFQLRDKIITNYTKKNNIEYQEVANEIKLLQQSRKTKTTVEEIARCNEEIENKKLHLRAVAKNLRSEKNQGVQEWELETPKDVRNGAIQDVCKAYKTAFTNLKKGNITHFTMKFHKKTSPTASIVIPKNAIHIKNGKIKMFPTLFEEAFRMGTRTKKKHGNIEINHDTRLVKQHNEYWLLVPVKVEITEKRKSWRFCGIDPGVRTFLTGYGNTGVTEYEHNEKRIAELNKKIDEMKKNRERPLKKGERLRCRKSKIRRVEKEKEHYIDEIHWKSIKLLLDNHDCLLYGDIKSHNIVKGGKNRDLNRKMNDLKFYKFRQRLLYKGECRNKLVIMVKEDFTTKTCSHCGALNDPGSSKIYNCGSCKSVIGRDINASKNILMKGIMRHL
jgi:transposase